MSDTETTPSQAVVVKNAFPLRVVTFKTIKMITGILTLLLLVNIFFSCKLFVSAIQIRTHLGYFINMVSSGDGDTLPSLQAVPVLFFLIINVLMAYFLYSVFDENERPELNRLMFFISLLGLILLMIILIIIITVIAHAYGSHEKLHDGIVTAMKHYYNNTVSKSQMDHLQIEFQCCGSKKYDEWYTIKWMDPALEQGEGAATDGNTPFSCCSMKTLSPCIHHKIEVTGQAYLYTPEFNLSISTRGCYEMIREKKQQVGWRIVGNLFLFFFLQALTVAFFRFIQTAHFEKARFFGHSQSYTIWVFGCYTGKVKRAPKKPKRTKTKAPKEAPQPPPLPTELKD